MKKSIAVLSDIHGNSEALKAVLDEINKRHYDEVICLGDIFSHGPNPKECLELLKSNNVKVLLGNDEYKLLGILDTNKKEKKMYKDIKKTLLKSDRDFLKKCNYYYEIDVNGKKILLSYYFIEDKESMYPFSKDPLDKNEKRYKDKKYLLKYIGHVHVHKKLDGNTIIIPSVGVSNDSYAPYMDLDITDDEVISKIIKVKY